MELNLKHLMGFVPMEEVMALAQRASISLQTLNKGTGRGNEFLGWMSLPDDIRSQLYNIKECAAYLRSISKTTVVVGIGGSYLGARAIIEALSDSIPSSHKDHEILYAGNSLSEDYLSELLTYLEDVDFSIVVISKSGTTTEPAVAFRLLKHALEEKYGKASTNRIVAITDAKKGALRFLANSNGYKTFVIPNNIGGRYSVLTPVGLLPIAIAGFDIDSLVAGAVNMKEATRYNYNANTNPALQYAAARNLLLKIGKLAEITVNFSPKLHYFLEWWKQLYGESEGKENKGILPITADFTTDLHSVGQYIQEGPRNMFETFISVDKTFKEVILPEDSQNSDQLNYLAGKRIAYINYNAEIGTILAHCDGGIPVIQINIPQIDAYSLGELIYFYELSCAVSGYLMDINPFNQPGVEAYKHNMFALLNKPGYETDSLKIKERLSL